MGREIETGRIRGGERNKERSNEGDASWGRIKLQIKSYRMRTVNKWRLRITWLGGLRKLHLTKEYTQSTLLALYGVLAGISKTTITPNLRYKRQLVFPLSYNLKFCQALSLLFH